jgi:hypothetical protein
VLESITMIKSATNFLPNSFNTKLNTDITEENIPFFYRAFNVEGSKLSQFTHHCFDMDDDNKPVQSEYFGTIYPILYFIEKEFKLTITELIRIKFNIITSKHLKIEDLNTAIHRDIIKDDGTYSFLYYINDSDGDTCFYSEDNKIIQQVSPVKNSGVLFNSYIKHRATPPINTDARFVINVIFKANES